MGVLFKSFRRKRQSIRGDLPLFVPPSLQGNASAVGLIEYPLHVPGRVFGSAMPFGLYDPDGCLFEEAKQVGVSVIVLLAEATECREKAKRDLFELYRHAGLSVLHFPIPNYGVPSADQLTRSLNQTIQAAMHGSHILIHCSAGLGRTTLYAACLAKRILNLSGTEALRWVGVLNARALLTPAQILVVLSEPQEHTPGGIVDPAPFKIDFESRVAAKHILSGLPGSQRNHD